MSKFRKSSLFGLAAAALVASAAMASPAAAAYYAYPKLVNNTADPSTITGVSWSGSYVQIPTPVAAGATGSGTYHTVLTSGSGGVNFTANVTTPGRSGSCYFTFNISNSNGTIFPVGHVTSGDAICGHSLSGNVVTFTIQ